MTSDKVSFYILLEKFTIKIEYFFTLINLIEKKKALFIKCGEIGTSGVRADTYSGHHSGVRT